MKTTLLLAILALVIAGCAAPEADKGSASAGTPAPASGTEPQSEKGMPASASDLGTEVDADHFSVTLTTENPEVTAGKNKFIAKVKHHGEISDDAKVSLALSMPGHGMDGPTLELKHTAGGAYEGEAELSMGGEWLAKVSISGEEGHSGEAAYKVVAMQK